MSEDAAAAQGEPVTTTDLPPLAEPEHDSPVQAAVGESMTVERAVTPAPVASAAPGLVQGAANQSPVLPVNAQAGAAKAHAFLGHLVTVAQAAQAEIEKYVPPELIAAAEAEAKVFIASVL